jgi:hypothetical protein
VLDGFGLAGADLPRLLDHARTAWAAVPDEHPLTADRLVHLGYLAELEQTPDDPRWTEPFDSPVGPLPKATALHAACFVIASQLRQTDAADGDLLEIAVAALADSIGALAVRNRVTTAATLDTGAAAWTLQSGADGWTLTDAPPPARAAIRAPAAALVDIAGGRAGDVAGLLARGELSVSDPTALLPIAEVLAATPGIPGGAGLRSGLALLRLGNSLFGRFRLR